MIASDRSRAYKMIVDAYGLNHVQRDLLDGMENLDNVLWAALDGRWAVVRSELRKSNVIL